MIYGRRQGGRIALTPQKTPQLGFQTHLIASHGATRSVRW
jgi:hypothetical protein